jgi:FlaA1/EpsC-like NDP-sugar epimerase
MDTRPEPPTSQLPLVLAIALDVLVTIESMLVALLFRFEGMVPEEFWNRYWQFAAFSVVVFVVLLLVGGAYRGTTSRVVIIATATSVMIATGALVLVNVGMDYLWARPVPPSVILLGGVLAFVQLVALRVLYARVNRERVGGN